MSEAQAKREADRCMVCGRCGNCRSCLDLFGCPAFFVDSSGIHIDPDCALDIFERLGARHLVPVHWGTVNLRLGLPSMPRRRLAKIAAERGKNGVSILAHGEQLSLQHVVEP